ncbi:hypothetical protein Gotur_035693, partial [Gossypium turneri]
SHARSPTSLEDIRLLLDQQSEAHFQWTPYEDPAIRAVIPDEFLQNPNAWQAKVALINYATVEMHRSDKRACRNTCHGLGSMASRIYYRQRRGSGNYVSKRKEAGL